MWYDFKDKTGGHRESVWVTWLLEHNIGYDPVAVGDDDDDAYQEGPWWLPAGHAHSKIDSLIRFD